ncbi:MAG: DNA repair protein RecO [Lachnospiraceae bacterium]|nr:DNA repair protein RecO [Lachnospiraceae bacterium]MBQ1993996.1 DNA repair protein RecO [Lachnospiraceae bacterium]MBQ2406612.1 DNA repair protein RecO [Lachnospiraceae bacterium]MEE0919280.1 DNA repair protein RecO [Lachnospiraceae bacterium]
MQDFLLLTGIVLKAEPIGEYDRRIVILTKERGKISAFARGARKPNSKLMAASNPFSFGKFKLYEGRNSYTLSDSEISNYFEELRLDLSGAYYGMYFLEISDYYTRENSDETNMLKLLYQSLRALTSETFDNRLVRYIFEIKSIAINGELPQANAVMKLSDAALYTIDYIFRTQTEKIFSFTVSQEVLCEVGAFADKVCKLVMDRNFKSLEILENIE